MLVFTLERKLYSVITSLMNVIGICFNISTLFLLHGYFWYLLEIQFIVYSFFLFCMCDMSEGHKLPLWVT